MERHELIDMMRDLELAGMRAAYDEIMRTSTQRGKSTADVLGDLLAAELAENTARAIRVSMSAAQFPTAKTLAEFDFAHSPTGEPRIRALHGGASAAVLAASPEGIGYRWSPDHR